MRDSTQRIASRYGTFVAEVAVDYGATPPTIRLCLTSPRFHGVEELIAGPPGDLGEGLVGWHTVNHSIDPTFDVCGQDGDDLTHASRAVILAASERWRVVYRRLRQAMADGEILRERVAARMMAR